MGNSYLKGVGLFLPACQAPVRLPVVFPVRLPVVLPVSFPVVPPVFCHSTGFPVFPCTGSCTGSTPKTLNGISPSSFSLCCFGPGVIVPTPESGRSTGTLAETNRGCGRVA